MSRYALDRGSVLIWAGVLLAVFGTGLAFCWNIIFQYLIKTELPVTPTSKTFPLWEESTVTMNFYLFNWTNPEKIMEKNYKPHFVEVGPYSFRQSYKKVNVTFHNNHTATYRRIRTWYFDPVNTKGDMDDNITIVNIIPLCASHTVRYWSRFSAYPVSLGISMFGKKLWTTQPVKKILFDGYDDPLLTIANTMPALSPIALPADKVAWFYNRNGTDTFDGVLNVETANEDMSKMGNVDYWNYKSISDHYHGLCSEVKGSVGDLFPPVESRNKSLDVFIPDFCRNFRLDYLEDAVVSGIPGYKYEGSISLLDNGTLDPDTRCNCDGDCLPSGVFNISTCRWGMPVFVSYPHFYGADPYYTEHIEGMNPNPDRHMLHFIIEPNTGVPLEIAARLQVNMLLQPSTNIGTFRSVPTIMFPLMWFEELTTVPAPEVLLLKLLVILPTVGVYFSIGLVLLGIILLAITILPRFLTRGTWDLAHLFQGKSTEAIAEMMNTQVSFPKGYLRVTKQEIAEVTPAFPEGEALLTPEATVRRKLSFVL